MKHTIRLIFSALVIIAVIAVVGYVLLKPTPVKVETVMPQKGAMRVTVDCEGKTRVHDRFVIAAPVSGRLSRITLREGDSIKTGDVIARIDSLPLAPLDPRQRAEANARVSSAEAAQREAEAQVEHIRADLAQAKRELVRAKILIESGDISKQEYELAQNTVRTLEKDLEAANYRVKAARYEVEVAKSSLLNIDKEKSVAPQTVYVRAPSNGRVLKVMEESERVINAGMQLVEMSNPSHLEIVVDALSTDAVKIKQGAVVFIEGWGGDKSIEARVRLVEPSAFTKISSLGIEEQRVNVIADFIEQPDTLGDGYRIEARIVIWEKEDALKVPIGALFRAGDKWNVFVIENKLAKKREVEIGRRTAYEAEVLSGIEANTEIILHPTNQLSEGTLVETERVTPTSQ